MKFIKPGYQILTKDFSNMLKNIELAGRTCYKSEDKITDDSASRFVANLVKHGHEAMIEHEKITVKFICDRGISHEIVRHRMASYAQESTRYCNYSKDKFGDQCTFIIPFWTNIPEGEQPRAKWGAKEDIFKFGDTILSEDEASFINSCWYAEKSYFDLLNKGWTPEKARAVLPNCLKTEIIVTMNLREWRHFFKLRCAADAHPQIQQLAIPLLLEFRGRLPVVFDDIDYNKNFNSDCYARPIED